MIRSKRITFHDIPGCEAIIIITHEREEVHIFLWTPFFALNCVVKPWNNRSSWNCWQTKIATGLCYVHIPQSVLRICFLPNLPLGKKLQLPRLDIHAWMFRNHIKLFDLMIFSMPGKFKIWDAWITQRNSLLTAAEKKCGMQNALRFDQPNSSDIIKPDRIFQKCRSLKSGDCIRILYVVPTRLRRILGLFNCGLVIFMGHNERQKQ